MKVFNSSGFKNITMSAFSTFHELAPHCLESTVFFTEMGSQQPTKCLPIRHYSRMKSVTWVSVHCWRFLRGFLPMTYNHMKLPYEMVSKIHPDFPRTKRKQCQTLLFKMGGREWEYGEGNAGEVSLLEASHSQTAKKWRHPAGCRLIFCGAIILGKKDMKTQRFLSISTHEI